MLIKFFSKHKADCFYVSLLSIIAIVSHYAWFAFGSILFSGDIWYWFPESLKEAPLTATWISNAEFGIPNIQLYKLLFNAAWFLGGQIGMQFTDVIRITHLVLIAMLGFLSPYVLIRYLTKDKLIAFTGALFYGSTTPFIIRQYSGHLSVALIITLMPLILYLLARALAQNSWRQWLPLIIVYWIGTCYEPRIMYIVSIILAIYFIFFGVLLSKRYLLKILMAAILLLGLSAFWILPASLGGFSGTIGDVAERGLFGNAHYSIARSFALFDPYWTGGEPQIFDLQPVPWYFWILPILASLSFLLTPDRKNKKIIIFFSIIWLLGLFFTKQAGDPLPNAFQWLREHLPGFIIFRSGSKFWFVESFGYLGLLSFGLLGLKNLWHHQWGRRIFVAGTATMMILSLWNLKPLLDSEFGGMFEKRKIPNDYLILKDYLEKQPGYFRTFWTPADSTWGLYTNTIPKISNTIVIGSEWKNYLAMNQEYEKLPINGQIAQIFKINGANQLFDISTIKYVIVPIIDLANDNDFFVYYGAKNNSKVRDWYISELDKVEWLKKINIGTKELVVYENNAYKPQIFTFDELYNLNLTAEVGKKANLIINQLDKSFYFTRDGAGASNIPLSGIRDLFGEITQENIDNSSLKVSVSQTTDNRVNNLYAKINSGDFFVSYQDDQITFYSQNQGSLFLNSSQISRHTYEKNIIKAIPAVAGRKYYILVDNQSLVLDQGEELDLGAGDKDQNIGLSVTEENIIPNPSFEAGLWQKNIGDCHDSGADSENDLKLNREEKIDGRQSLQLEAVKNITCAGIEVPIVESGEYVLSFYYQSPNSDKGGYYIKFNDDEKTVIKNSFPITDDEWHAYAKRITIPEGATNGILYLYAYPKDKVTGYINRYDDFQLGKLSKLDNVELFESIAFEKIPLTLDNGNNVFEYRNDGYNYKNIITNPSFESGMWQEKVADCHNYDANPIIDMKLSQEEKTDGAQSLQLEATRHVACTAINLPVKSGRNYQLSFDYQSPNASVMSYTRSFNDNDKTGKKQTVPIDNTEWHKFIENLIVPGGANQLSLYLYAKPINETENIINRFDNFQLIENPNLTNTYYWVSEPNNGVKNPEIIDFELLSPTKKLVHIKGASLPFHLAMSEAYHTQWQLELNNAKAQNFWNSWLPFAKPDQVDGGRHYKLNDFLNGWYVEPAIVCADNSACSLNPDGSYNMEMVIEYWPQRWLYFGLLISGLTLFGCAGGFVFVVIKNKINYGKSKK